MKYSVTHNEDGSIEDIIAMQGNIEYSLSSICNREREQRLVARLCTEQQESEEQCIILFLGVGFGGHIKKAQEEGNLCVIVDIEGMAHDVGIVKNDRTHIISGTKDSIIRTEQEIYAHIIRKQIAYKGLAYIPLLHPFHRKIDTGYYTTLFEAFKNDTQNNMWKEMREASRFIPNRALRVLLLPDHKELIPNIEKALQTMGIETRSIALTFTNKKQEGYAQFLKLCVEFKPDFLFTINHVGLEESGSAILHVAEAMAIPIASWFVDSPDLLIGYEKTVPSPLIQIFSWEKSRIEQLEGFGYSNVQYLPLGADVELFAPKNKSLFPKRFQKYSSSIAFIGGIGGKRLDLCLQHNIFPYVLLTSVEYFYKKYLQFPDSNIKAFLQEQNLSEYNALSSEKQREFAIYLFFYMNARVRVDAMKRLLPLHPIIIGEEHAWRSALPKGSTITIFDNVDYMKDLPYIYQMVDVNINITSIQMKTAVNQRVFDCPSCGAFVLTDAQAELEELFDVGKEVITYTSQEELYELAKYYTVHKEACNKIVEAGRKRVIAEHTYLHRMKILVDTMIRRFR